MTTLDTLTGRDRILFAAAQRLLDHGYAATSLRDIAADCGIKAGSIYYHFASKEALVAEILDLGVTVMVEAFDAVAEAFADAPDATPADERLRAHVGAHLSVLFERGPITAVHVGAFRSMPQSVREAAVPHRDAYEQRWTALLADLQAAGEMDPELDTTLSRLTLLGAMNFAVEWFDPRRDNVAQLADVVTRQFWSGTRAPQ